MKIKRPRFNHDVRETRQTPGHFGFLVEVINPRNGWSELLPEELDIVSALHMVEYRSNEEAKLYSRPFVFSPNCVDKR
jgi:hypothetical protein